MGRKSRKRIIYESDDEYLSEEVEGELRFVPWSLKVSDCFDEIIGFK